MSNKMFFRLFFSLLFAIGVLYFQKPVTLNNPQFHTKQYLKEVKGITVAPSQTNARFETATVTRVVDGDTIELSDGRKLRYIGINAPESVDPRRPVQCFGKEAAARNKELVLGKTVRLEKDVSETDKFGRILRYVSVGDTMVNEELLREGYAYATAYPPDVKYQNMFDTAQKEARENNRGLWALCSQ